MNMHPLTKNTANNNIIENKLNPGLVASYGLRPGNGAGPIFWKVRDRREIEDKVKRIKRKKEK